MFRSKTKNKKKFTNHNKTLVEILLIFVWSIAFVFIFSLSAVHFWNSHNSKVQPSEELHGAAEGFFTDVPSSHPDAQAVQYLRKRSIVGGSDENTFRPEDLLTRAELITMIEKALHLQPHIVSNSYCFPDVKDQWFAPFVCFAVKRGAVHGFEDGLFKPYEYVTHQQMGTVMVNFFHISLSEYQLVDQEIDGFLTRSQAAEVLYKVLVGINS